jgi:hypothetical protein
MHENLDGVEEIKVSSDRSLCMVFTFVFFVVEILEISGGKSLGWYFFANAILFLL